MTATTGNPHTCTPADQGRTRQVLLRDDRGQLTLRRLRPWHRALARCAAARLDRELAAGTSPETSATLAARAIQLTSMRFRRDLATTCSGYSRPPGTTCWHPLTGSYRSSTAPAAPPGADPPGRPAAGPAGRHPGRTWPCPGAGRGDDQPAARRRHRPALP